MDKLLFWPLAIATLLGGVAAIWYFNDKWNAANEGPVIRRCCGNNCSCRNRSTRPSPKPPVLPTRCSKSMLSIYTFPIG